MTSRKYACIAAAAFVGFGLTASATEALSQRPVPDVIVKGPKIDPETQRVVRYGDLNLAYASDQRTLRGRIWKTANNLCFDLNGFNGLQDCSRDAVHSTDDQVAAAIDRAKRQMAGLSVGPAVSISMVIGAR